MQQLHDEHAAALWGFCLRLTGHDRARAEDVVQETLLRAWRNRDVLDSPPPAVRAWLFTVARNIVIDEWRSRSARARDRRRRRPRAARDQDDHTDQLLLSWVVAEALTQLSEDHRAVLLECYYRGRPVAEAAAPARRPGGHREVPHPLRAARAAARARGDGGGRMSCELRPRRRRLRARCPRPAERRDFERHLDDLRRVLALGAPRRAARAARPASTRAPWPTPRAGEQPAAGPRSSCCPRLQREDPLARPAPPGRHRPAGPASRGGRGGAGRCRWSTSRSEGPGGPARHLGRGAPPMRAVDGAPLQATVALQPGRLGNPAAPGVHLRAVDVRRREAPRPPTRWWCGPRAAEPSGWAPGGRWPDRRCGSARPPR